MTDYYELRELTPKHMRCIVGACPAIYAARDVTPRGMMCSEGCCPGIHKTDDTYLIIGERVDPEEAGLAGKVGENEVLIRVPRPLIDEKEE